MIKQVDIRAVQKDLMKTPKALVIKFQKWVDDIETYGLEEVRKARGWHDHTLKGDRAGQRAIYLNKRWRAIYVIEGGEVKIVKVIEVHPHEY
jgi:plasmid maintenance system killer protein